MLWNIMGRIDTVMIGILKTSFDVGVYQAAMPTSQFLFVIPGALSGLFLPVISELLSKNKTEDIGKIYKTVSKWIFYLNFPLFLVFAIYPNAVINMLFGSEYIGAGNSLRILSIGYIIFSIGNVSSGMINLFEKTKYHILNAFVAVIAAVSLNYLLIPIYGIEGAAIANMMTFVIYTILPIIETYMISKHLPFHSGMLKSFVAGAISITVVYSFTKFFFTDLNIWILAPMFIVFLGIYSLLLLILRGLGEEDIMILKAIEKKTGIKINFLRDLAKKFI
jgi:O-antigen/teichoic acid export membrane protein